MKFKLSLADFASLSLTVGMSALTVAVYERLPARMPTHFDAQGVPNGFMNRFPGAWILPLICLAGWLLVRPGTMLLPHAWRTRMEQTPTALVWLLVALLTTAMQSVMLYAAIVQPNDVAFLLGIPLGAFWTGLGLVMPRVRRNPWIGVRIPWTLSSDENWARTHRVAGHAFCIAGVVTVVGTIVTRSMAFGLTAIIASSLVPMVYSFVLARRLPPET